MCDRQTSQSKGKVIKVKHLRRKRTSTNRGTYATSSASSSTFLSGTGADSRTTFFFLGFFPMPIFERGTGLAEKGMVHVRDPHTNNLQCWNAFVLHTGGEKGGTKNIEVLEDGADARHG
jgi:hypothetical protein